ncbi:MAG TPA: thermonuclease family protein [Sphingomicrobium sp.]|nr:thermonuclease family protein [Sphingomicrobium sp.]
MSKHGPRGRGNVTRFWPDAKRKPRRWAAFVPLWAGAVALGGAYGSGWFDGAEASTPGTQEIRASFGFCHTGGGTNCVVDGDTLWLGGVKIRVADIDAPETHEPRCAEEQALGDQATRRLRQMLNGGAVSLHAIDRDEDRYGRKLRIVRVDGENVGERLVDEGLARWYRGGRRAWC